MSLYDSALLKYNITDTNIHFYNIKDKNGFIYVFDTRSYTIAKNSFNKIKCDKVCIDITVREFYNKIQPRITYSKNEYEIASWQHEDNERADLRFRDGYIGEYAVLKLMFGNVENFYSFPGGNYANAISDLASYGFNVGVKCSRFGKSVLVPKKMNGPEIICNYEKIEKEFYDIDDVIYKVYVLGYVTQEEVSKLGKIEYVESENCQEVGVKVGICDFDKILFFDSDFIESFKKLLYANIFNVKVMDVSSQLFLNENLEKLEKKFNYVLMKDGDLYIYKFPEYLKDNNFTICPKKFEITDLKLSVSKQEELLKLLSDRILVGYGIGGFIHLLQKAYDGDNKYNLNYIDINTFLREYDKVSADEVAINWCAKSRELNLNWYVHIRSILKSISNELDEKINKFLLDKKHINNGFLLVQQYIYIFCFLKNIRKLKKEL